jgi:LptD protein
MTKIKNKNFFILVFTQILYKNKLNYTLKVQFKLFFIIILTFLVNLAFAQKPSDIKKNSTVTPSPNVSFVPDSIARRMALENKDTSETPQYFSQNDTTKVKFSKDSLDAIVDYGSKDSLIFDNANNLIYLYGAAYVNYKKMKLTADYIVIDLKKNIATAEPSVDTSGKQRGIPNFDDGSQKLSMKKLGYNFKTKKGVAYDVTTKYNDAFVHGGKSKFVGGSEDSTKKSDVAYSTNAIFTTCSAEHPHFGILSSKQKVIPNKLIVVGPSRLIIGDVPTPLWLPFAAFPLSQGKKTGLIFPRDYEYNDIWGFGLRNLGWYFPINDNYDVTLQGDIYVKGNWGVRANGRYNRLYKSSGSLELGYANNLIEIEAQNVSQPSWNIRWSHQQDSKAHPTFNFSANVNISGNSSKTSVRPGFNGNYQSTVNNDFKNATTSQFSSSVSFSKTFPGKPYSLSGSFLHSQNVATREVTMELPNLDFQMQTIFPFKIKKRVGEEKWFEKVALQYRSSLRNSITTKDSLQFSSKVFDNMRFGIKHEASTNITFNLFKYFNLSPSISYREDWLTQEVQKKFNKDYLLTRIDTMRNPKDLNDFTTRIDTLQYGKVDTAFLGGFKRVNQFSIGASLSTRVFGTMQFKKGALRGIRHTMTPSIGFNYSPNYRRYEGDSLQTDYRSPQFKQIYNRYENAIFGAPPTGGEQAALTYNLTNLFEMKTFNKKDSTFKKTKLLENVSIGGSYNMVADSFRWSEISMGTGTNFFNGLTTLSVQALFDPYGVDKEGRRVKISALKQNGKLLNLVNATLNLNTSITIGEIKNLILGKKEDKTDQNDTKIKKPENQARGFKKKKEEIPLESFEDLLKDFRISHTFSVSNNRQSNGRDTLLFQNNLYTSGNIPISKKWSIRVGNIGYDFINKQLTYPDFGFRRDLHCWEMGLDWQPQRGTYNFYLRVKPGTLDFLKIPYAKNIPNNGF